MRAFYTFFFFFQDDKTRTPAMIGPGFPCTPINPICLICEPCEKRTFEERERASYQQIRKIRLTVYVGNMRAPCFISAILRPASAICEPLHIIIIIYKDLRVRRARQQTPNCNYMVILVGGFLYLAPLPLYTMVPCVQFVYTRAVAVAFIMHVNGNDEVDRGEGHVVLRLKGYIGLIQLSHVIGIERGLLWCWMKGGANERKETKRR